MNIPPGKKKKKKQASYFWPVLNLNFSHGKECPLSFLTKFNEVCFLFLGAFFFLYRAGLEISIKREKLPLNK